MVRCVLSQLQTSELYTLSCGKGLGLRQVYSITRASSEAWSTISATINMINITK